MATRSTITLSTTDDGYDSIYCHWDGAPSYEGSQVLGVYNTMAAAEGALEVYKGKVAADTKNRTYVHSKFDDYIISEHILNADAAS